MIASILSVVGGILFFGGWIVGIAGSMLFLIAAFGEDLLWGIACLFCGPAWLIFLVLYWDEAKKGLLVMVAGCVIAGIGASLMQLSSRI